MRIGLVTDSTADVPLSIVEQHDIRVVPALINIGDESYKDGIDITREEYYDRLPYLKPTPTTSAPSAGSFQERYENLLESGAEHVISIHPPDRLSGIYNAARLGAESFGGQVMVLDGGQVTLGLGFQVMLAAEAIARGLPLEEILSMLENVRSRSRVIALLDTLEYLRRSGRVSWARAMVGGLLNVKPLVELRDGIVNRLGQARTRAQGVLHLTEKLRSWGPIERLAVLHTNAEAAARQLLEDIKPNLAIPPLIVNVTTTIGTHVGPNGLGFAVITAV